jgi:Ni/Co efflux regulator RcnB
MQAYWKIIYGAGLAIGLAGAPGAWAQEHPDADHPPHDAVHPMPVVPHPEGPPPLHAGPPPRGDVHPAFVHGPVRGGGHWHHGDRFTGSRVMFTDFGRYHLRPPPPGYAWVQDGNELVLISLATGVITDVVVIPVL